MQTYTVWKLNSTGINEKCLLNTDGDYVGIETGNVYLKDSHYASKQMKAKIVSVDSENKTGMYHLYSELWDDPEVQEDNRSSWKKKFVGCLVTVESSHYFGDLTIYRCLELCEYFSSNEIEILSQ